MQTTIDNTQRVFIVKRDTISTKHFFCNLKDIPKCIKELENGDPFEILHIWNYKVKKCSKKYINEMLKADNIDYIVGGKTFVLKFNGRQADAIGKLQNITFKTFATSKAQAIENAHKKYDHITQLTVK